MGIVKDVLGGLTGRSQRKAADAQVQSARLGIEAQERAQDQLREDLNPFVQFGLNNLENAQTLFGPNAARSILSDPVLQALQNDAQRRILAQQAAVGRAGTQETANSLQEAFLRQGAGLLSQQRSDLLNAIGIGQSSAAQVGASGLNTGSNVANLLTQQGNAASAGIIGQQNAANAGLQNLAGIGGGLLNYFQNRSGPGTRGLGQLGSSDTDFGVFF